MTPDRDTARQLLTPRQYEVWDYTLRGYTTRQIAHGLGLRTATVRDHLAAATATMTRATTDGGGARRPDARIDGPEPSRDQCRGKRARGVR